MRNREGYELENTTEANSPMAWGVKRTVNFVGNEISYGYHRLRIYISQ